MKNPKLSIDRVNLIWEKISRQNDLPRTIAIKVSRIIGYNPIPITLLAQQSDNKRTRSEAIQAYYVLIEKEMVRKAIELSSTD